MNEVIQTILLFVLAFFGYGALIQKQKDNRSKKKEIDSVKKIKEKYEKGNMDDIYDSVNNKYS